MSRQVFYITYVLLFLIGGTIALLGILPFRPFHVSALALPLILLYGIRFDRVARLFVLFTLLIIFSGIINGSSLKQTLYFLRFVIVPYSMYYLVRIYINPQNIRRILNLSMMLAMLQLPVVLVQRLFYEQLIPLSVISIEPNDFTTGTFYVKNDPALNIFLFGLILFLLFDPKHNYFVRNRMFKAAWFSLAILLSHSLISHLMLFGVWGYYLLRGKKIRAVFSVGLASLALVITLAYLGATQQWLWQLSHAARQLSIREVADEEVFLMGGYSRGAAILYYISRPLSLFGDGPSKYYDPLTRTYLLGNTGQLFAFYGEVGLIGLLLGYAIFHAMAYRRGSSVSSRRLYFLIAVGLTITSNVQADASVMLAYNLLLSTGLLPERPHISQNHARIRTRPQLQVAG